MLIEEQDFYFINGRNMISFTRLLHCAFTILKSLLAGIHELKAFFFPVILVVEQDLYFIKREKNMDYIMKHLLWNTFVTLVSELFWKDTEMITLLIWPNLSYPNPLAKHNLT